ncbi:thiamine pyrophosphate-binding protein [Mammaliicoccus lentus]|uniref:thiamine pyrophosphate-binding protein n=1 Tax=Mammaliicoccus lentus TaxID=42858 RepID=UPI001071E7EF|nr:thiamine pyrophosphate-binding protein [Mammaliicoccus lentus]MBF0794316.1 thiamine pyrophosphate-binding protein [Mammaliicoccus lentus]TFV16197.1 thiamine pyrophosphate-binding protein [Mammaliicoccus lentus]
MNNKIDYTVANVIVDKLTEADVDTIFGIVSIHNMPIYNAIAQDGRIKLVTARGESGAVNMADGYARTSGKMGVVLTSTGAGAGNGAGSLTESWNAETPLLHITGEIDSNYIGKHKRYIHECKDELGMMEAASKAAYQLDSPYQIHDFMSHAIKEAQNTPTGPITAIIPTNLQHVKLPKHEVIETATQVEQQDIVIPEEVIETIVNAKKPIIWVGGGVIKAGATDALQHLVNKLQAAVITSESGKGAYPETSDLCLANNSVHPEVTKLLKESDVLITIGTHLRGEDTLNWELELPQTHIDINSNPEHINKNYIASKSIIGDANTVLESLNHALKSKHVQIDESYVKQIANIKAQMYKALSDDVSPYNQIAESMNQLLAEDDVVVRDVTVPAYWWGNHLIQFTKPRTSIYTVGGGIGQGLPLAIGAQMGTKQRRVVNMAGDGGFMVNAGELATLAEQDLPVITLLFKDGGYGILRYLQSAAYDYNEGVDLHTPDFKMLSESVGIHAEVVENIDEFHITFEHALQLNKPAFIIVDMDKVGPTNVPYSEDEAYIESFRPQEKF